MQKSVSHVRLLNKQPAGL